MINIGIIGAENSHCAAVARLINGIVTPNRGGDENDKGELGRGLKHQALLCDELQ